jgi:hypothetical protein
MNRFTFAGMVVFFLTFITLAFRLEKRLTWPYSDLQAQPHFGDAGGYAGRWVADATQAEFTLLGWSRDLKGELYRVDYALLISPDRTILAVVGAGSLGKLPIQGTWLHTPTADGRSFYSTDKQSGVQIDLSRNWTSQLVPSANFNRLWQRHKAWIQENGVMVRPFTQRRELAEFRELRERHFRFMEQAGLIDYVDPMRTQFRFTTLGAIRTAVWSYLLGLSRGITEGRFPRNA